MNSTTVSEVYGVTQRNTAVTFPAGSIYSAVSAATGVSLSGIQLLSLPTASQGTVYVGSGSTRATTNTLYTYGSGTQQISQLRFVPTSTFTGSVQIPYVAYNSSGTAFATGLFSLGVLSSAKSFRDVSSSTWCYKYVVELSDADVIDGYSDGTFKPDNQVTYGAALKLIMLAAGYTEQKPVNSNVFSGYLAKAQADGIITRSDVDLSKAHYPSAGGSDRRRRHEAGYLQPLQRPALYRHHGCLRAGAERRRYRGGLLQQWHQHLSSQQHPDPRSAVCPSCGGCSSTGNKL